MNASSYPKQGSSTRPIAVGDVIKTFDNTPMHVSRLSTGGHATTPMVRKHRRVVVHLDATQVYLVPIFSDLHPQQPALPSKIQPAKRPSHVRACSLKPSDMGHGVLDHDSYMAYHRISKQSLAELERNVDCNRIHRLPRCPPHTLIRILSGLETTADIPDMYKVELKLPSPGGRVLRSLV